MLRSRPGAEKVEAVGARLFDRYLARAEAMVQEGYATADDVDTAMRGACRLRKGPIQLLLERRGRPWADPVIHSRSQPDSGVPAISVAVVGSGTMAVGIAETFARAGRPVTVIARSAASAAGASQVLDRAMARGFAPAADKEARRNLITITITTGPAGLGDHDLVIECVSEDLRVKGQVFAELDQSCRAGAVLATTTSSLSVHAVAAHTRRPESVVGLHFFNPAPVMPLVELVATARTGPAARASATAAMAAIGKDYIWCTDRAGFIVNRLLVPYLNDAVGALAEGHPAAGIDSVLTSTHGFPMGPLHLVDLIGTDIVLAIAQSLQAAFGQPDLRPEPLLVECVRKQFLGVKNGTSVRDLIGARRWSS